MGGLVVRGEIVTMDPQRSVVSDGAVVVHGEQIAAVGSWPDIRARYPEAQVVGDGSGLVIPGAINAHQHLTGDRLIAGCIPDSIDSDEAIFGWAVPVHEAHTGDDDELSATLAAVGGLINGVTCTVEAGTVAHPLRAAAGVQRAGMRTMIGRWGWDAPGVPFGAPAVEVLAAQRELIEQFPPGGLVQGWVTLVGHDLVTDELFAGASALAARHGTNLTFHMSPHPGDAQSFLQRAGCRPLVHLQRLGVLGQHVLVAHAVHLDDDEVAAVLDTGTAVAACPWAYLRLAQGVTVGGRYADLWRGGGRLAVGCDTENAGDVPDVLRAATLLVGLCRDRTMDPRAATASDALYLATIGGAEAIGQTHRIGSIEVGKQADLVVHDRTGMAFIPPSVDPVRQLMWGSDGRSVCDVFVAGRHVVMAGRCVSVDVDALRGEALARRDWLLARRP